MLTSESEFSISCRGMRPRSVITTITVMPAWQAVSVEPRCRHDADTFAVPGYANERIAARQGSFNIYVKKEMSRTMNERILGPSFPLVECGEDESIYRLDTEVQDVEPWY